MEGNEIKDSLILIVDDISTNVSILESMFKKIGYNIISAGNAEEGISIFKSTNPDLVLLDIVLPGMSGYEACAIMHEHSPDTPVIFISAMLESGDKVKGFKMGAVDYVTKPFNKAEILARINTHLQLKKSKDTIKKYSSELEEVLEMRTKTLIRAERQAAFGQLIQGIVHNLRSPLTGIVGGYQLLNTFHDKLIKHCCISKEARTELDNIRQTIYIIEKSSTKMTQMINNLMYKSRTDAKEDREIVDLNKLLASELDFFNSDLKFKHNITKCIELCKEQLFVEVIPSELTQVFQNLLRNSIDALHDTEDAEIHVASGVKGDYVFFALKNNGPIIPNEIKQKIFDPFFTTKPTETSKSNDKPIGTGLGLHFCANVVSSYKGNIQLQSDPENGTEFTILLPRYKGKIPQFEGKI